MAGRGVDIKVNDEVKALGGLYIIGTERHENRRIDNQLRGRSGRQGDNGTTQFYLSLEDSLLRIFGSDKIKSIMERLGVEDGEYIESKMVTRAVEKAQKKLKTCTMRVENISLNMTMLQMSREKSYINLEINYLTQSLIYL